MKASVGKIGAGFKKGISRNILLTLFVIAIAVLLQQALSVSSVTPEVFLGSEVVNNKVSVDNKDLGMTFDYLINHDEGGWYVFDGQISAKSDINTWDLIVASERNINVQLGFWQNMTKKVPETTCTNNPFTYPNGTVNQNSTCGTSTEEINEFGWNYAGKDASSL